MTEDLMESSYFDIKDGLKMFKSIEYPIIYAHGMFPTPLSIGYSLFIYQRVTYTLFKTKTILQSAVPNCRNTEVNLFKKQDKSIKTKLTRRKTIYKKDLAEKLDTTK